MKTAKQIKAERLCRRIFEGRVMVDAWYGRPYGTLQQMELYKWKSVLKHREAMLNNFMSIAHN